MSIKIGFCGVPGAGKTSISRGLASALRSEPGFENVELCAEYARRHISKYGAIADLAEQYRILNKQIEWEDSLSCKYLITDSPINIAMAYAMEMLHEDRADKKKAMMYYCDIFKKISKLNVFQPRYDIVFMLPPNSKIVDDGVRASHNFDDEWKFRMDAKIQASLQIFRPNRLIQIVSDGYTKQEIIDKCKNYITEKG